MSLLSKEEKTELSDLLAKGHRKFGKVLPRKPYRDDDDSGVGSMEPNFVEHPLLAEQPVGAASDLVSTPNENQYSEDSLLERENEATEELKKQPTLQRQKQLERGFNPTPEVPGG